MKALIYFGAVLLQTVWTAMMDPDACGCDFSDEVRDILKRREAWEMWTKAISTREDVLKERIEAWSNYRQTLEYYSTAVTREMRSFAETISSFYQEQINKLTETRLSSESKVMTDLKESLRKWQEYRKTLNSYSESTELKTIVEKITTSLTEQIFKQEKIERVENLEKVLKKWENYSQELHQYSETSTSRIEQVVNTIISNTKEEIRSLTEEKKGEIIPPVEIPNIKPPEPPMPPVQAPPPTTKPEPPMPVKAPSDAEKKFERIEKSTYKFMSKLLDLVDFNFQRYSSKTVEWSKEVTTTQEFSQSYTELKQELTSSEVAKLDSVKILADKVIMCARLGRTDFQDLATINEELAKLKSNYGYSAKNQAASQWSSDWLMRMDLTMKKSMTSSSQVSSYSQNVQKTFSEMKKTSKEHSSVIAWSTMRSEELLSKAEKTGKVEMDSVKAIVKASMKIMDQKSEETSEWLHQVEESTSSSSMWTSESKDFWSSASFEEIQTKKSSISSSFSSEESHSSISTM